MCKGEKTITRSLFFHAAARLLQSITSIMPILCLPSHKRRGREGKEQNTFRFQLNRFREVILAYNWISFKEQNIEKLPQLLLILYKTAKESRAAKEVIPTD